jgi:predicted metal-dependent peptidase
MKGMLPSYLDSDGDENPTPDHSTWKEFEGLDEATKKLVKSQTQEMLKEVADQVTKSRGLLPGEIAEILKRIAELEPPKFNWRAYLRRFAGGSNNVFTKKSRKKYNVRFEENPGIKIKPKRRILVAVDTSGSVSTNELNEFLSEIHHIHKTGTEVTIIQCDSAISYIGTFNPRMDFEIHGRGGTSFHPVTDYYDENKEKYNCLIYLTDGEAPAPDKCQGPVLWVMSSQSSINESLQGFQIKLN